MSRQPGQRGPGSIAARLQARVHRFSGLLLLGLSLSACGGVRPEPRAPEQPIARPIVAEPMGVALCVLAAPAHQDDRDAFAHAAHEVVADLFRRAPSPCLDAADVLRYEQARRNKKHRDLPSAAAAPCLVVATLEGRPARASIRVYDVSDPSYLSAQGVEYWHGRPLIFEDSAALAAAARVPDRRAAAAMALREIAACAAADPHLRSYLGFAASLDDKPEQDFGVSDSHGRKAALLREGASKDAEGADVAALFPLAPTPRTGSEPEASR